MELTELGPTVTIEAALAELAELGSVDAIAARLIALGIRGGHVANDCPIYHYVVARAGIVAPWRVSIGSMSWQTYQSTEEDPYMQEGGRAGDIPELVQQFIEAHDAHEGGTAMDLCNANHRASVPTPWVTGQP